MQRLEVSGAVRPIHGSLGVKRLNIPTDKKEIGKRDRQTDRQKDGSFCSSGSHRVAELSAGNTNSHL